MLASINPLGERSRNSRWIVTAGFYLLGSAGGGALLGGLLGLVGAAAHEALPLGAGPTAATAAALAAAGLAIDLGVGGLRVPTIRRQVDEDWLARYRNWLYGLGYGFQLGLGVVTIVTTATVYLMWALALLAGSPAAGALVGTTFGTVRALPVLAVARVGEPPRLRSVMRRVQGWASVSRHVAIASLVVVTIAAVASIPGATWAK